MTLGKLQLIATVVVELEYKVCWLKWWNRWNFNREAIGFPKNPASEDNLKPWLNKATFRTRVRLSSLSFLTFQLFMLCQIIILALNLSTARGCCGQGVTDILIALGGLDGDVKVDSLPEYLEKWRICLWNKVFICHFSRSDIYRNETWWKDVKGADNIVKRLIFQYVSWEIFCSPHLFQSICSLSCWLASLLGCEGTSSMSFSRKKLSISSLHFLTHGQISLRPPSNFSRLKSTICPSRISRNIAGTWNVRGRDNRMRRRRWRFGSPVKSLHYLLLKAMRLVSLTVSF